MDIPPLDLIIKFLLLQSLLSLLLLFFFSKLLQLRGSKKFAPLTSGSVLLTGASAGIGRTAAVYLARKGFTILAGVRREVDAKALLDLKEPKIIPIIIDVAKPDSINAAYTHIDTLTSTKKIPPLCAIINNAGLLQDACLEFHDLKDVRHMFEVNTFALISVTSKFLPMLRKSHTHAHPARVVNIGSVAGKVSFPRYGAYAASKHAVEGITDALRCELTPEGMSVSLIEPGFCRTELFSRGVTSATAHHSAATQQSVPPAAIETYPHFYSERFEKKNARPMENGSDPVVVCEAMYHALNSSWPKSRYPVANVNKVGVAVVFLVRQLLPDRMFDEKYLLNC